MLDARERRAWIQRDMLDRSGKITHNPEPLDMNAHNPELPGNYCLVCLTLNIAGDIKRTPMTRMLFAEGVHILEQRTLRNKHKPANDHNYSSLLTDPAYNDCNSPTGTDSIESGWEILETRQIHEVTGDEAFWLIRADGREVKEILEIAEDSFPSARLFDFDVLLPDGSKLSRGISRKCLVCGNPVTECARSRRHGLDAVKAATNKLLRDFCADAISTAAYSSLLDELYTTPKPGLVDLANTGAHDDMDVPLFELSANTLRPYFRDAALMGIDGCGMADLRKRGIEAENEMFRATRGVNTHKGMIYSMGLLSAGMGKALSGDCRCCDDSSQGAFPDFFGEDLISNTLRSGTVIASAVRYASEFAREDAEIFLARSEADPVTNGARALQNYGARGAMGEAADGFPDAIYCLNQLKYYNSLIVNNDSKATSVSSIQNVPGVLAFCDGMARLEDTNLLHRGGEEGLSFAREEAARISGLPESKRISEIASLDEEMIRRNLSPGGSADVLALAYFLYRLTTISGET